MHIKCALFGVKHRCCTAIIALSDSLRLQGFARHNLCTDWAGSPHQILASAHTLLNSQPYCQLQINLRVVTEVTYNRCAKHMFAACTCIHAIDCFQQNRASIQQSVLTWKCDGKIVTRTSYTLFRSLTMPACHGINLRPCHMSFARALRKDASQRR